MYRALPASHQHTISGSRQEAMSFFSKQQDKAVSVHTRGSMRASISNRNKQHQERKMVSTQASAWNKMFFSGNLSKALTILLHFKIPMASKLRMKKISDWLSDYSEFVRS